MLSKIMGGFFFLRKEIEMTLEKLKKLEKDLGMKEKELQEVSTVVATGTSTLFFMFMTVDIHVHVV